FVADRTNPKRQLNFQIAETVMLQIQIAADAPPGERELRLITPAGLSNPLVFHVGQLPEYALFGAGSGNVLTKVTKYSTMVFFGLALVLGYLQNRVHNQGSVLEFEKQMQQKQQMQTPVSAPPPVTPAVSQPAAAPTNNLLSLPLSAPTNAPEAPTQSK
ncbi:MAG: preprotein translocase subunit SecG, partial [Limisphaerales bacterium]